MPTDPTAGARPAAAKMNAHSLDCPCLRCVDFRGGYITAVAELELAGRILPAEVSWPLRHASPNCACGVNDAGRSYIDPICRET